MACYITGSEAGDARLATDEMRKTATRVTRLLCSLCEITPIDKMPPAVKTWWKKHQKTDEKRQREEQEERDRRALVKTAKKKLTPQERKALGY